MRNYAPVSLKALFILAIVQLLFFGSSAWAVDLSSTKFYGYIDLEYKQTTADKFDDTGPDDANLKNGSFDQHHFNLLVDAPVSPKLSMKGHIEFEHGLNQGIDSGNVILEYAFGEYIVRNWLKLRGGKMLTPWGIYNEIHDATPAYLSVSPPEVFYRAFQRGGFALIPKWITGMAALGEVATLSSHDDLEYNFFIGNGESRVTINESEHDDNPNKAVGGRVQITTHDETVQVGLTGYYGDKALSRDLLAEIHWAGSILFNVNWKGINIHGEYGQSELGGQKETAWYIQTSWRFGRFTPYLNYQTLDPDADRASDNWTVYLAGLNVKITDALFYKIEWSQHDRQARNKDIIIGEDEDYGEFRSALTLLF